MMNFLEHLMGLSEGKIIVTWVFCVLISLIAMAGIRAWLEFSLDLGNRPIMIMMYIAAVIFAPVIAIIAAVLTVAFLIVVFFVEWILGD